MFVYPDGKLLSGFRIDGCVFDRVYRVRFVRPLGVGYSEVRPVLVVGARALGIGLGATVERFGSVSVFSETGD